APLVVAVNGDAAAPKDGAVRTAPSLADLAHGVRIDNKGRGPVWRTVSVDGDATEPLPAENAGFTLHKTVWTLSGQPADLNALKQNDRVIVILDGTMQNNLYRRLAAIDLLPAGLEIDTALSGDQGKVYPFVGKLT